MQGRLQRELCCPWSLAPGAGSAPSLEHQLQRRAHLQRCWGLLSPSLARARLEQLLCLLQHTRQGEFKLNVSCDLAFYLYVAGE